MEFIVKVGERTEKKGTLLTEISYQEKKDEGVTNSEILKDIDKKIDILLENKVKKEEIKE